MAQAVLAFNERLKRLGEVIVVLLLGALLTVSPVPPAALWSLPLLFFVIRPLAVAVGLLGSPTARVHRVLLSWFGIRGIGSLYYLTYALQQGMDPAIGQQLAAFTFSTVAVSVIIHGLSVTPLMTRYRERIARRTRRIRQGRLKEADQETHQDENKTRKPGQVAGPKWNRVMPRQWPRHGAGQCNRSVARCHWLPQHHPRLGHRRLPDQRQRQPLPRASGGDERVQGDTALNCGWCATCPNG